MIADLAKYIDTLHDKGRNLLNAYMTLKKHLDELRNKIDLLKRQNDQKRVREITALFPCVNEAFICRAIWRVYALRSRSGREGRAICRPT